MENKNKMLAQELGFDPDKEIFKLTTEDVITVLLEIYDGDVVDIEKKKLISLVEEGINSMEHIEWYNVIYHKIMEFIGDDDDDGEEEEEREDYNQLLF